MDKMSPKFGYLPGYLSDEFYVGAKLMALGCEVQNKKMDDSVTVDRELVTGASQMSAQNVAEAAVKLLVGKLNFKMQ